MIEKKKIKSEKSPTRSLPSPFSPFHLEADPVRKGLGLLVSGILGINDFSDSAISLATRSGCLSVLGERLELCIYENNTVCIVGKVEEVKFGSGKNR